MSGSKSQSGGKSQSGIGPQATPPQTIASGQSYGLFGGGNGGGAPPSGLLSAIQNNATPTLGASPTLTGSAPQPSAASQSYGLFGSGQGATAPSGLQNSFTPTLAASPTGSLPQTVGSPTGQSMPFAQMLGQFGAQHGVNGMFGAAPGSTPNANDLLAALRRNWQPQLR